MRNPYTTPADFWQERDFGAKISAVFEFIGAHWRPLGKCLVYFVLPGALLLGIGLGMMTNTMWNRLGTSFQSARRGVLVAPAVAHSPLANVSFQGLGLAFAGGALATLLLLGTVYGYLRARLRLPAAEPVTPAAVWQEMRAQLGRVALAFLLFVGLSLALGFGFSLVAVSLQRTPALLVPLFFLLGLGGLYASIALSLYLPVLWLDNVSVAGALGRCFQLVRGKWWSTLGLLFVAGLIQVGVGIVFAVPQYAVLGGKMLQLPGLGSDVLGLAAQAFYSVGLLVTYCIPLLALAFQYFNLVERRESYGLRLLVSELGQPAPTARTQHYQPDEEGEY